MARMMYNWIKRRKLNPRDDANGGISNFIGRIKGMHVFIRNFTYVVDFMIVEDISSILDPKLSQVVLGKPFIEIYNMTHDPSEGAVRFIRGTDEIAYKMPHKIEQYNSLSDLEKEHTKSVYLRNKEDKRKGVEYVISKILGFYKEWLELGPEYLIGVDDEGEVTFVLVDLTGLDLLLKIIIVNVIPPEHVDDVPVVEPNQYDVPVIPEPVLVHEDEDSEEEEFEEKEPQEEEDDMEVDIEEDENDPELTYPYEEVGPLNPPLPASESELKDVIEVEDTDSDGLMPGLMRRDINSLFGRMASLSRRLCGRETAHALVEKKGKAKDEYYGKLILDLEKAKCKKLKKELEEARIMPPKSAPMTQAAIRRMIKESVDAAIAAERARHANAGNEARGSRPVRGQDAAPVLRECTFTGFMKCNLTVFHEGKKVKFDAAILQGPALTWWNAKGLTENIKGEVTSSKPANLNEAVRMAHELMEQKSQARDERILEGKKRKWENFQSGNSSGKSNQKDNSRQTSQNNQNKGNTRAMITAPTKKKVSSGSLSVCERCFTRHDGPCTIKCHKCGTVGHKARYCKEKSVATGANAQPILTCYCGKLEGGLDSLPLFNLRIGLGCVGLLVGYVALKVLRGHYHRCWIELFSDYDCEIRNHPSKANVVADALSRKKRKEAIDEFARLQKGLDEMIEQRSDGTLYYLDRIMGNLHMYWWPGMKKDIVEYVSYKMERFARLYLDEIVTRHGVPILIISDRDSRFILLVLAVWQRRLGTQFRYEYGLSPQIGMVRTCAYIQTWKTMLLERVVLDLREVGCLSSSCCVLRYNNSYHSSVRCAPFEALYEGQLIGPELVQETSEKISQIKDRLRDARDCQKSCGKLGKCSSLALEDLSLDYLETKLYD
ncbi:putative reverse transcriptase domain-containing protein [Tanacetum coccineum]